MGTPGWTPVDESAAKWTSVQETPPQPQGLWEKLKSALSSGDATAQREKDYQQQLDKVHGDARKLPMPGVGEGANLADALSSWDSASGGEIAGGIHDIFRGDIAKGLHRILGGAGAAALPAAPLALPAAAASPVTTGLSIGGGIAGSKLAKSAATGLGATPEQAELAGDVGALAGGYAGAKLPAVASRTALLGRTPQEAYQSALKPSTALGETKIQRAVQTGLEQEIPVSRAGVDKLDDLLSDLQDKVTVQIGAGQGKTINPYGVASRLSGTAKDFATQVNPETDLNAISEAGNEFLRNNPGSIPAAEAQAMKVGTYRQLGSKAYGEMQTATKEAQKALARGIKEELASQFPELNSLNAQESRLYDLQGVLEKAVNRIGNHQLLGIGTPIVGTAATAATGSPSLGKVAMVMKAVLDNPSVKSRLAIAIARNGVSPMAAQARVLGFANALGRAAASQANGPSNQAAPSATGGGTASQENE